VSLHLENLVNILIGLLDYWIQIRKWISVAKLDEVDPEILNQISSTLLQC
jgi:hypothetical protein